MALPGSAQAEQATAQAARLTGRGAVLGMALLFTVGLLAAAWLGVTVLAGAFFVLGCGLAAWYTRPADLLTVVLVPPILFSGALILVEAMTASGSLVLSVAAGSVVVLVSVALWLAAGLVLTMAIAWRRGLPQCVRDLRRDLRAERAERARAASSRPPKARGLGSPARQALRRAVRAGPAGSGPRTPGTPKASGPGSKGPGNPGSKGPGGNKVAGPGPRGLGKAKAAGPTASTGPGAKSTGHAPRTRQAEATPADSVNEASEMG
jgi:hypothetical protein